MFLVMGCRKSSSMGTPPFWPHRLSISLRHMWCDSEWSVSALIDRVGSDRLAASFPYCLAIIICERVVTSIHRVRHARPWRCVGNRCRPWCVGSASW